MTISKKKMNKTGNKSMEMYGHQQVVEYMKNLEHPLKEEVEEVRKIILSANKQITEHIKWNAPSFCFNNEDRVTFNLHSKEYFRLVFHCGAKVKDTKGEGPFFDDTTGLLDWVAADRAIVKFSDMDDVKAKKEKLGELITKWIEVTSSYCNKKIGNQVIPLQQRIKGMKELRAHFKLSVSCFKIQLP